MYNLRKFSLYSDSKIKIILFFFWFFFCLVSLILVDLFCTPSVTAHVSVGGKTLLLVFDLNLNYFVIQLDIVS